MLGFALENGFAVEAAGRVQWACSVEDMGQSVVNTVKSWHDVCATTHDLAQSSYVVMTHDRTKTNYQVLKFGLELGDPAALLWEERGKAITGTDVSGAERRVRWEFYQGSGGQLKWYPEASAAQWASGIFTLPDAPRKSRLLSHKAHEMFGDEWPV